MVTVRVVVPLPDTATVPLAVPVALSVTFALDNVTVAALPYVMVYVIGPFWVSVADGALIETVTGVLSAENVVLAPEASAVLPARSDAVPAAMEIPIVPVPVMLEIVTVREAVPLPETAAVPSAVPVLLSVTLALARVTLSAPE
jgi:hypothetical protein